MEPSPEIASGSSRYECEVLLTKLRRQMVRQAGYAPASPVWKTEILLLNDWRIKVAAGVGIAPTFPVLQTGANLSQLSSVLKWRAWPVLPRLGLARTGEY